MRKSFYILLSSVILTSSFLVIFLIIRNSPQPQADNTSQWLVYDNENYGITFKYPVYLILKELEIPDSMDKKYLIYLKLTSPDFKQEGNEFMAETVSGIEFNLSLSTRTCYPVNTTHGLLKREGYIYKYFTEFVRGVMDSPSETSFVNIHYPNGCLLFGIGEYSQDYSISRFSIFDQMLSTLKFY